MHLPLAAASEADLAGVLVDLFVILLAAKLGGNAIFGSEWYAGLLDDVRVYNRALSATEIQTDMSRAAP